MKKIGILTTFDSWDQAYSPCQVVSNQLSMLLKYGYTPVLFTLDIFKDNNKVPEGVEIRAVLPTLTYEPYQGIKDSRNVPTHFEEDVAKVVPAYEQNFKDIDIMFCHDIIFQDSFLPFNAALRKMVIPKNLHFYHWTHSGPSLRLDNLQPPIEFLFSLPPQSTLVYMNGYDTVRIAEMYGVYPKDVRVVHNPIDYTTASNLNPLTKKIINDFNLNEADVIGVYPLSTTRMGAGGKQLHKAIKVMAGIASLGKKVKYIIPNAHANGDREKMAIQEMKMTAQALGLGADNLIFTSLIDVPTYEGGISHEVVLELFELSDVFIFPSVSENGPLVLLEAALKKNLMILNEDFTPMKDFIGNNALYFKFDSVMTTTNHPRGEDVYYQDVAKIIIAELESNRVYKAHREVRQKFNLDYVFRAEVEPLIFEQHDHQDNSIESVPTNFESTPPPKTIEIEGKQLEVQQHQQEEEKKDMSEYKENPEIQDFNDFDKVHERFKTKGIVKAPEQVRMYEAIAKNWCIGKSVIDAGCGMGIGTNILGREALGVLGVDNELQNIAAAKQFFENQKIKFEVLDLLENESRPIATADIVVCIEVIEHVKDYDAIINSLKKFFDPKRKTILFISSPNRNNENLGKDHPNNEHHVREWTAGEFYDVLTKHFQSVVMFSGSKVDTFEMEETVDGSTQDTPILAKCEFPI